MKTDTVHVFVSSTWLDLQPEREAVEKALQRMREIKFTGMEYFGSRGESTQRTSLDEVNRSHVYIGILGSRYGSGITEEEYHRARERGLTCFIYLKDEATITAEWLNQTPEKAKLLAALKDRLRGEHTVTEFANADDLAAKVTADLHRWLFDEYLSKKLENAMRVGPHTEVWSLLTAIKDMNSLNEELLMHLRKEGYAIASGAGSTAINGDINQSTIAIGGNNVIVSGSQVRGDVVGRDKIINIYEAPVPIVTALHQLPRPPGDFTGRDNELEELAVAIEQEGVTISGLHGLAGIGKTALALKLAEQLTPRYPHAQFYLDLRGASHQHPFSVVEALSHVIRAYHPTAKLPDTETELRGLYLSVLHGQRALLLMDNALNREQVEPLIPPTTCTLLVTSRQHFILPGIFAKNLNILPATDARDLLLKIAPHIGEQADTIARLCGYLPLALRLAASALAEHVDLSAIDYAQRLMSNKKRLELIDASLRLSYDLLNPQMQKLWRTLAVFPVSFDVRAVAAIWDMEHGTAQDKLSEFVKYSLVEWDAATSRYRLHDLVRLFADNCMSDEERKVGQKRHAEFYLYVLREADDLYQKGGEDLRRGLLIFDLEWANIQAGYFWSNNYAAEDATATLLCNSYPDVGARLLYLRQRPHERINWLDSALVVSRRLKDCVSEGTHLGNLGLAYADSGETLRAIDFHRQRLAVARELGDKRSEGQALGNLGAAYYLLGETRHAIEFYEQDLVIARNISDRRGEGVVLGNLGLAYASIGERGRAIKYLEQALSIAREVGNRRSEGLTLGNIGAAHFFGGDYYRAIELYEKELLIARELGDRSGESLALGNLGEAYAALNDHVRAIEFYEQALTVARSMGDRRTESNMLFNISLELDKIGERSKAIAFAEEALVFFKQLESPYAAKVREQLITWHDREE